MPDSTSTALARNPESSARAALRVVPRPVPQPTDLPLPDPPRRPFIALARMCVVGGPMLKHVFMVVTSYCPVMASDWEARGFALRETLRRDCEFAKVETLDRYLKLLQLAGWIDWTHQWGHGTRGQSASEFLVRLSPVQVADRIRPPRQGGHYPAKTPMSGGSLPELPINKDPHVREQRPPCQGTKTPMSGGAVVAEGSKDEDLRPSAAAEEICSSPPAAGGLPTAAAAQSDLTAAGAAGTPSSSVSGGAVETGVGASEKQIKLLVVCADRLKATPTPELWRSADRTAVQAQIAAAMEAREEKPRHRHQVDEEIRDRCNRQEETSALYLDGVQRCRCGAVRFFIRQKPEMDPDEYGPWFLCGETATAVILDGNGAEAGDWGRGAAFDADDEALKLTGWRRPFTWSEVETIVGPRPRPRHDEDGEDEDGEDMPTEDVFA